MTSEEKDRGCSKLVEDLRSQLAAAQQERDNWKAAHDRGLEYGRAQVMRTDAAEEEAEALEERLRVLTAQHETLKAERQEMLRRLNGHGVYEFGNAETPEVAAARHAALSPTPATEVELCRCGCGEPLNDAPATKPQKGT